MTIVLLVVLIWFAKEIDLVGAIRQAIHGKNKNESN